MQSRVAKQFALCFAIFLVVVLTMVFSSKPGLGFCGDLAALVFGTLFTGIGVVIGDAVCRFVRPDVLMASDGTEMFKKKVFWMIGPQVIGWLIGYMAFTGFMHNVLGINA